jgi:transcriptional regulator with XRE-family HTH domain
MFRVERHGMSGSRTGSSLTVIRERRMWTQLRLAEEAGVSPTTVSGIENGRISRPHFGTLRKLARALGVQPEELISAPEAEWSGPPVPLSLEWAMSSGRAEFEEGLERATLDGLYDLSRELNEEHGRLRRLYGETRDGDQRRLVKDRIRDVSAQSGSVEASIEFHPSRETSEEDLG